MMKAKILLFLLITIYSCNKSAVDKSQALSNIESYIKDDAFKANEAVDVMKLDVLEIRKIDGHSLDRDYVNQLLDVSDHHRDLAKLQQDLIVGYGDMIEYSNAYDLRAKMTEAKLLADNHLKTAKKYIDEAVIIERRIDTTAADSLRVAKIFLKAKYRGGERGNVLDTLYYVLNDKFEVIPRKLVK